MNTTSHTVRFLLDGKEHTIVFDGNNPLKPSTTLLNYLRSLEGHKGVKEGCAEGDCGACTVVVATPGEKGKLKYTALDSCLVFLPMIHGKQVITVENLKDDSYGPAKLHPVQDLMISQNGSQCGYCTPGFVMSMFALYKNHHNPSREVVLDALTGNLCRCTGYQPIVNAALKACQNHGKDHFSPGENDVAEILLRWRIQQKDLSLTGGGQKYFLPASLFSALSLREKYPDAVLVCGATDVALRQTKKNEHFPVVIDLSAVWQQDRYSRTGEYLNVSAGITLEELKNIVQDDFPALHEMLVVFGSLQIRNIATIGGNIGSASPIGDTLPLLFAYKAIVNLTHTSGASRSLPVEEFVTGYRQTDLRSGELISSVTIPFQARDRLIRSYKVSRRKDLDISTVSAAFSLKTVENVVEDIVMVYGGMAAQTQRARNAEAFLAGKTWSRNTIEEAMKIVEQEFTPLSDARADKEARKIAASNLLMRFFVDVAGIKIFT
ncbi:MAG: xanthine dehydrogenase small subunit [Bacteroidota bacterium]